MRLCALFCCCSRLLWLRLSPRVPRGSLRGRVTDPSRAVVPGAVVTATNAAGKAFTVQTDQQGNFQFSRLAPGSYNVTITAKGFGPDQEADVKVTAGQTEQLEIGLVIQVEQQNVEVQEETPTVGVSSENSASTSSSKGKDLDALSDDPDELAVGARGAGRAFGRPNGGQIYVDGFTGGQLPPKSAIREIRINQNPFSAEYDKLGYGRIEIFTKPGTDKFHGQFMLNGNSSAFNTAKPVRRGRARDTTRKFSTVISADRSARRRRSFLARSSATSTTSTLWSATVLDPAFNTNALTTAAVPIPQSG